MNVGDIIVLVIAVAVLIWVMHLYLFGDSHAFWTGGPIRRAILKSYIQLQRAIDERK
jgi:hypothetical protein